jgi:hypothetical protein
MKFAALLMTIASLHSHDWEGDQVPIPQLAAQVAQGQRIGGTCGTVSRVGVHMVREAGGQARLVGTLTRRAYNGSDDGHILTELRTKHGWTLFDLDYNRRAPWGVGVAQQVARVKDGQAKWVRISSDDTDPPDLRSWYRDIFGLPTYYVESRGGWFFRDRPERSDAESLGFAWAPQKLWNRLTRQK